MSIRFKYLCGKFTEQFSWMLRISTQKESGAAGTMCFEVSMPRKNIYYAIFLRNLTTPDVRSWAYVLCI